MLPIAELLEVAPVVGEDALFDRVAAAALDEFSEHGIRRTSMEDVARRAGVSRMTVFRRFASKQGLVDVVIAREVHRGMEELDLLWARRRNAGGSTRRRVRVRWALRPRPPTIRPAPAQRTRGPPTATHPRRRTRARALPITHRQSTAGRSQRRPRGNIRLDGVAEVIARLAISLLLTRDGTITLDDPQLRPPPSQPHATPHAPTTAGLAADPPNLRRDATQAERTLSLCGDPRGREKLKGQPEPEVRWRAGAAPDDRATVRRPLIVW